MKFWISCLFALGTGAAFGAPLTSQFNYQGKLETGGVPANGTYDLRFEPYGAAVSGTSLGAAVVVENVAVVDGVFTTAIDFGAGFFVGDRVFLAVGVREGASTGAFTTLAPRQEITATPYAQTAIESVGGGGLPTGVVLAYDSATLPDASWIWSDGRTIGNALSGATNRANADTLKLYVALWYSHANSVLPIQDSTGAPATRGATPQADFDAAKRLPVPDRRGRVDVGRDDMGGTPADRITTAGSGIDGVALGASGGSQTETLTVAQMPSHFHTGITLPASHDDNPDPPLDVTVIGNNFPGSPATYTAATTGPVGGGQAHRNVQPSRITNFIIKL